MPRLELRLSDWQLAELDRLRGGLPRGTFLKLVSGLGVGGSAAPNAARVAVSVSPARAPVEEASVSAESPVRPEPKIDGEVWLSAAAERQARLNKAKGMG